MTQGKRIHVNAGVTNAAPATTDGEKMNDGQSQEQQAPQEPETKAAVGAVEKDLQELAALREERDRFVELLRRTQADFENYQKRAARELEQERKYVMRPLALDILPAIDNLD